MEDILLRLNNIFDKNVTDLKMKDLKVKMRNRKLTIRDAILFRIKYSEIGTSQDSVAADINYENNVTCQTTSFTRKEANIAVSMYKSLFEDIKELYYKNFINKKYLQATTLKLPKEDKICAVDGTYSNTNVNNNEGKLETSLNMCAYDVINDIPLYLDLEGSNNKNKEVKCLIQHIKDNKIQKNTIIVLDRAYAHYNLFKLLDSMSIKYIVRLKDNSLIRKENVKINSTLKYLNENARMINSEFENEKKIANKKGEIHTLIVKNKCKLLTNLMDANKYSDEIIKEIYKRRWDIEVFFKLLKNNFKFRTSTEKNPINYAKQYYSDMIIVYITKMLTNLRTINYAKERKLNIIKYINKKDGSRIKCNIKYNKSLIIRGIFSKLIRDIVYSKLTIDTVNSFMMTYIKIRKNESDRHFEHTSKIPFSKWYIKYYHDLYKYTKIIDAIQNDKIDKLNKNLKLLCKNITIIK